MTTNKNKFVLVKSRGLEAENIFNEFGLAGWKFKKMEPFYQENHMMSTHVMRKLLVCFEKSVDTMFHYRAMLLRGNGKSGSTFRVDDFTEATERVRRCGFKLVDFRHIIELRIHHECKLNRVMLGYFCVWEIALYWKMANNMNKRIERIERRLVNDPFFQLANPQCVDEREAWLVKLCELIERVNEFDAIELQREMGKEWYAGLSDVIPDYKAVAEALSFSRKPAKLIEDIIWCSMGHLIASGLPNG